MNHEPGRRLVPLAIAAQPENQGQALLNLIDSARLSLDIAIYQIGNDLVAAALVAAVQRGVALRLMLDFSTANNVANNAALVASLRTALSPAPAPAPHHRHRFAPRWASRNFHVTHQKAVIVDAVDLEGQALPALPDSARLLVCTGNFADYQGQPFYRATDFYLTLAEPDAIREASAVFSGDFCGAGVSDNQAAWGTQRSDGRLTWSNGCRAAASTPDKAWFAGQYPAAVGYPSPLPSPSQFADQGNVAGQLVSLVDSARPGDVLRIYNEEFESDAGTNPVHQALLRAAQAGVEVRIIMSYSESFAVDLAAFARAGGTVFLLAPQAFLETLSGCDGPQYIHAKAFLLSDAQGRFQCGWAGSTNLSNDSLFSNRELGVSLRAADAEAAAVIVAQLDRDGAWAARSTPASPIALCWTAANVGASGTPSPPQAWNLATSTAPPTPPPPQPRPNLTPGA